jgi:DNA helicase-2/ATP-dependent DNA helicase PcrA
MNTLNERQKEAVECTEGPLLILAGAGAGKTKTLTERIARIIKNGVLPRNILAITFTNKAAKEMEGRIIDKLQKEGVMNEYTSYRERPTIKTFHSLGVLILKENAHLVGMNKHFTILDTSDTTTLLKEILREQNIDEKTYEPARFRHTISRYKGDFISLESLSGADYFTSLLVRVWTSYEKKLKEQNSVDFDDLILKSVKLLEGNDTVRKYYQNRFLYIHVDEYQDTSESQYRLCKLLAGEKKNICVVGDGDQNIYSWRGANIKNILSFSKDFEGAKEILLEENYRSTPEILEAANAVIAKNTIRKEKNLFTSQKGGDKISLVKSYDETGEALFIAKKIQTLLEEGEDPKEIAVLYRANFQSRVLEEGMLAAGVPYEVLGTKFFDRKEIKDTLAYLRCAINRDSLPDLKRALEFPKRGFGKVTLIKLFSGQKDELSGTVKKKIVDFWTLLDKIKESAETKPLEETLTLIIKESGIEKELAEGSDEDKERLENIRELVSLSLKYEGMTPEESLERFLEESALVSDQDTLTEKRPAVKLMTIHASKGLEFNVVFIAGLEQDLLPHKRIGTSRKTKEESEEERRLFYVALTRARKKLYLSYTDLRTIFGTRQINTPSEFIADIPLSVTEDEEGEGPQERGSYVVYL